MNISLCTCIDGIAHPPEGPTCCPTCRGAGVVGMLGHPLALLGQRVNALRDVLGHPTMLRDDRERRSILVRLADVLEAQGMLFAEDLRREMSWRVSSLRRALGDAAGAERTAARMATVNQTYALGVH